MTLQEITDGFKMDPRTTKAKMVGLAYSKIMTEFSVNAAYGCSLKDCEMDCDNINYSHYCDMLGWPDFQDGGIFEQVIEIAGRAAIEAFWDCKPNW